MNRIIFLLSLVIFVSCAPKSSIPDRNDAALGTGDTPSLVLPGEEKPTPQCEKINGTPWVPEIPSRAVGAAGTSSFSKKTYELSGKLTGLGQSYVGREVEVSFDVAEDLGEMGSISLSAELVKFPENLPGGADPVLVSLKVDGKEWVNLSEGCRGETEDKGKKVDPGFYHCVDGSCTANKSCNIEQPSAFLDRLHWERRQFNTFSYISANTFPSCDWTGKDCKFKSNFMKNDVLPFGKKYVAKYVLLASQLATSSDENEASFQVQVVKKKKTNSNVGGVLNVNVVLVGKDNITASRTTEGQRNLNWLFANVVEHFNQTGTEIELGSVSASEWGCETNGDQFQVLALSDFGRMIAQGSVLEERKGRENTVNLFLVSELVYEKVNGSVLGVSGGIPGTLLSGTAASGLAFSTFGQLSNFNANCDQDCPTDKQDDEFYDMGVTIAHEIGHFLGLNHLSESSGKTHDFFADTPECSKTQSSSSGDPIITKKSCNEEPQCLSSCSTGNCPAVAACEFNHLMWWHSKTRDDGNIISSSSASVISRSPFIQ